MVVMAVSVVSVEMDQRAQTISVVQEVLVEPEVQQRPVSLPQYKPGVSLVRIFSEQSLRATHKQDW
jgi:hypothetical protein